ncbi:MAG: zinc metalloprotease HtpX [Proteobacteria bacterium]|nr:zinc metalloprotease HtpX [Pseudomonadota bacterium]
MTQLNLNAEAQRRHNLRNTLHTILLLAGTGLLMGVLAYLVLGVGGLLIASVFGIIGIVGLGRVSPKMVLNLYKARPLAPDELPELQDVVRQLAKRAGLTSIPQLYYVPSKLMNAFAVGTREDSAIAVTDALLRTMTTRQLAGILGHETAHIMNGDLRVMGLADVLNRITGFVSALGLFGIPLVFGVGLDVPLLGLLLMIFAPTIGGLLQLALSRAREYDADLDGVSLTGDPDGLASALQTLEEKHGGLIEGMVLPGARFPQPSILRSHPRTEDRIARIRAVTLRPSEQIVIRSGKTQPSFVPQVPNPHIRWHRMGVYY